MISRTLSHLKRAIRPRWLCLILCTPLSLIAHNSLAQELVSGVVTPSQQAKLAFESSGILIYRAKLGDRVEQGTVLAQLNSRSESAALSKAEADLNIAQTELKKARRDQGNMQRLHKTRAVSENDLLDAQIALSHAEAGLQRAKASLETARINLELKTLTAPFSGIVTDIKLQKGEYLEAGDDALTLANIDQLQLSVDIPLELSLKLTPNTETLVHDNGKDVATIRVDTILPVLDPASGLRRVVWQVTPMQPTDVLAGRYVQLRDWSVQTLSE